MFPYAELLQQAENAVDTAFATFEAAKAQLTVSTQGENDAYKKIHIEQQYGNPISVFIARRNHTVAAEQRAFRQKTLRQAGLKWAIAMNDVDAVKYPDKKEDLAYGKKILEWLLLCEGVFDNIANMRQFPLPPAVECTGLCLEPLKAAKKAKELIERTQIPVRPHQSAKKDKVEGPDFLRLHATAPARHTDPLGAHPISSSLPHSHPLPPPAPPSSPSDSQVLPFCACTIRSAFWHVENLEREKLRWQPATFSKVSDRKMRKVAFIYAKAIWEVLGEMEVERDVVGGFS